MTATDANKLAWSLVALALTGAAGSAYSATPSEQRKSAIVQQDAGTPDCEKTPEDPRCKDKK